MVDGPEAAARARANMTPIVAGQAVSLLGDHIALFFALPLFVLELTGRERDLGLTAAAETLPMLLFGFAAGVLLDRVPLRGALIISDLARAAAFTLLASSVWLDVSEVWTVLAVAFLVGSMSVVFESGLQAMLPTLFTGDMLVTVNSRLQFAATAALVLGPAVGGQLLGLTGGLFEVVFLIDAATYVVSAALLLFVREVGDRRPPSTERFGRDFLVGLARLWREGRIRWATLAAALANLAFAPVAATLVLYAEDELGLATERAIGLYFAAYAAVGAIGVVAAPALARRIGLGRLFIAGMFVFAAGVFAVSWTGEVLLAVVPTGVAFAGVSWLNISLSTIRQRLTPPGMRGRVIAASRTIAWLGLPVGAATGGLIADSVGILPVYRTAAGVIAVIAVVLLATPLWSQPVETEPAAAA